MPGSLADNIEQIQRTAASVRERLNNDAMHLLSKLSLPKAHRHESALEEESFGLLETTIDRLSAFSGVISENMTRGHGWIFLEIGRRLERAINISTLLRSCPLASEDPKAIPPVFAHLPRLYADLSQAISEQYRNRFSARTCHMGK